MPKIIRNFIAGIMNKDLDERLIPKSQYRHALNVSIGTSQSSDVGAVENTKGNINLSSLFSSGDNALAIGAVPDEANNKIYWFVASDNSDYVLEYSAITGSTTIVLQCNKPSPTTPSILGFDKGYVITGVNTIRGLMYWTDNLNEPRGINIDTCISKTTTLGADWGGALRESDILVIKKPPLHSPTIALSDNGTAQNNLSEKFLYFSYRFKYADNEYSAMAPFSAVCFAPLIYFYDYGVGNNPSMVNKYNQVKLTFGCGDDSVEEVQLLFRDTRNINVNVIESFKRESLVSNPTYNYNGGDNTAQFDFNNNKVYTYLSPDQLGRLFDNVPLAALAQELVGSRLLYGNYLQFRDLTLCDGNKINLNYVVDFTPTAGTFPDPQQSFRSDRDYEIGIAYLDDYGRMRIRHM